MSVTPDATASSTTQWIAGRSTTGSISLGCSFVSGRKREPRPAAGITAFIAAGKRRAYDKPIFNEGPPPPGSGGKAFRGRVASAFRPLGWKAHDDVEGIGAIADDPPRRPT